MAALQAGKHVLLEKPSVSNSDEAEALFKSPLLQKPDAPILLDGIHNCFHPAWKYFMSKVDRNTVKHVKHCVSIPKGLIKLTDIRYNYSLAGGAIMDVGSYGLFAIRNILGLEPSECEQCTVSPAEAPADPNCDSKYHAKLKFPNGKTGEILGDTQAPILSFALPSLEVWHEKVQVFDAELDLKNEKFMMRKISFRGYMVLTLWNSVEVEDYFEVRSKHSGQVIKEWTVKNARSIHTPRDAGIEGPGEFWWKSYRYQLEEFVHRVLGRPGDGVWISAEESIAQMKVIDMVYKKSSMGIRHSLGHQIGHQSIEP